MLWHRARRDSDVLKIKDVSVTEATSVGHLSCATFIVDEHNELVFVGWD